MLFRCRNERRRDIPAAGIREQDIQPVPSVANRLRDSVEIGDLRRVSFDRVGFCTDAFRGHVQATLVTSWETRARGHAYSVRRESVYDRKAAHGLPPSRLVSTNPLDLWFEKKIKPKCQGEAYLTRFADDFVGNFQYRRDAERFQKDLTDRFGKFGLELAEEKTRVMRFGRFVRTDLKSIT